MTPLVVGEDFSKLPPSMEYILSLRVSYMFKRSYRTCLKSIYSIDGNVTWRCGEIGIRYALMGKTSSSCMLVRIQTTANGTLPSIIMVIHNRKLYVVGD